MVGSGRDEVNSYSVSLRYWGTKIRFIGHISIPLPSKAQAPTATQAVHCSKETAEKVNNLVDFGGKANKRHFDWTKQIKCKALRGRLMGAYYKHVTEAESRKKQRNVPAVQQPPKTPCHHSPSPNYN